MIIPGSWSAPSNAKVGVFRRITDNDRHATVRRDGRQYLASDDAINQGVPQKNDDVQQDDQFAWPPSHRIASEYLPAKDF